jgi:hypothetical protein
MPSHLRHSVIIVPFRSRRDPPAWVLRHEILAAFALVPPICVGCLLIDGFVDAKLPTRAVPRSQASMLGRARSRYYMVWINPAQLGLELRDLPRLTFSPRCQDLFILLIDN